MVTRKQSKTASVKQYNFTKQRNSESLTKHEAWLHLVLQVDTKIIKDVHHMHRITENLNLLMRRSKDVLFNPRTDHSIVDSGLSASAQAKINVLKRLVTRIILICPAEIVRYIRRCVEQRQTVQNLQSQKDLAEQ